MSFNLTPTITISTHDDLVLALDELAQEGVDQEWLDTLHDRAEPFVALESLTAACRHASCRPPTSGGTGGSRPSDAAAAAERVGRETSQMAGLKSEFGKRITEMLGHPSLAGMSKSAIEGDYAKRNADARASDLAYVQEFWNSADPKSAVYVKEIQPWRSQADSDAWLASDQRQQELADREGFDAARLNLKSIYAPGYVAKNSYEQTFLDARTKRLASNDPYEDIIIPTSFGEIKFKSGVGRSDQPKYARVGIDTEEQVRKIGHAVEDEIALRTLMTFDVDARQAHYTATKTAMMDAARAVWPDVTDRDIIIQNYDGETIVNMYAGNRAAPDAVRAVTKEMAAIAERGGIVAFQWEHQRATELNRTHQAVMKEVLTEVRAFGGEHAGTPRQRKTKSGRSSNEQVTRALEEFPSDWIAESSANGRPLEFKQTRGRAHYLDNDGKGGSVLTLDGSHGTAVHELAHRMEFTVPGVRELEQKFWARRTENDHDFVRLGKGYGKNEITKPDEFFSPYVGKSYDGRAYEVMSMGWQYLQTRNGYDKVDSDYRAFVLGTLVTAYRN